VPEGEILAGVVGKDRVFVWRNGNGLKAYGASCPHLGAPLNEGIVVGATIRCPWHHACFDLATGEATAAPAFDALLEHAVALDGDRFSVKPAHVKTPRRTGRRDDPPGTMAIVGGGAAGFAAADAIRKLGWRGGVTIFSEEREQPYDRTLLTKDYLEGSFGDDRLPIARHSLADLGVDFEGDESVRQVDPRNKRLRLANGDERPYEKLLLATGATPRRLDVPGGDLPHVMVLRSLQDCRHLLAKVTSGARVAVVGGSFIAMETAASLSGRGLSAHVIAPEEHPL
jgi:apoptosis-inducing factor 3